MEFEGLAFTVNALTSLAVLSIIFGVALVVVEMGNRLDESFQSSSRSSHWMHATWSQLDGCPWRHLPGHAIGSFVAGVAKIIDYWFGQSEKNVVTSGVFLFLVLIAIPLAALLNYLRGGSGFLLSVLLISFVVFVLLLVVGEIRRLSLVATALAALLFGAIFLFVPGYVVISFTDLILGMPVGHAAIGGVLVTPLLYLLCHSVALLANGIFVVQGSDKWHRVLRTLSASIPLAYLVTFGTFLYGHFAATQQPSIHSWQLLISSLMFTGLSFALTIFMFNPGKEGRLSNRTLITGLVVMVLATCAFSLLLVYLGLPKIFSEMAAQKLFNVMIGLSVNGETGLLGPVFWIMHMPFLPLLLLGIIVLLGILSKLLIAADTKFLTGQKIQQYPMAGGGVLFIVGGIAAVAGLMN